MIARALVAHHLAIYHSVLAYIGVVVVARVLFEHSYTMSFVYGAMTVGGYWIGQAGVALIQRERARRSDSLD